MACSELAVTEKFLQHFVQEKIKGKIIGSEAYVGQ